MREFYKRSLDGLVTMVDQDNTGPQCDVVIKQLLEDTLLEPMQEEIDEADMIFSMKDAVVALRDYSSVGEWINLKIEAETTLGMLGRLL